MDLYYREYGYPGATPLVFLHGLFGSAANWGAVASRFEAKYRVILPDLRNHGRSPHAAPMGYPEMAGDLLGLFDRMGLGPAVVVGHSMGGKVAMWLALEAGERVAGLAAVDIAPVRYANRFEPILSALASVDTQVLGDRQEADAVLARSLAEPALRDFLLQNLVHRGGRWQWRIDLVAIRDSMERLLDFPPVLPGRQYLGPVQFIYGGESDYVTSASERAIHQLFPFARLRGAAGAGHWVYTERPEELMHALETFLGHMR